MALRSAARNYNKSLLISASIVGLVGFVVLVARRSASTPASCSASGSASAC